MDPEFATIGENSGVWMSDVGNRSHCAHKTPEVGILIFTLKKNGYSNFPQLSIICLIPGRSLHMNKTKMVLELKWVFKIKYIKLS